MGVWVQRKHYNVNSVGSFGKLFQKALLHSRARHFGKL